MKKKVIILSLFVSVFLLTISVSSVEATDTCKPGEQCYDNQTNSCKYCSASNRYSGGPGYVQGGIINAVCEVTNKLDCEVDAACWTSEGNFGSREGSKIATAVDCCISSNCTGGKICENGKCIDSGLGVTPTTPVVSAPKVKPTAIMEDPTATSVTGKGTTSNGAKITNIKIYKDTSGCGSDPRVHLDGCTGTGLFSGAPETNSGNIWSAKVDWSTAVTKETKYSVKVQDSNGVWSDCVSKIFATTTGADPDRGFGTGVDTSKGGNVFTCSGFEPNGTTKIMCPASESKKSAVQNSWTSVGTSESSCGDLARCEYYTVGVTTNPVISPDTIDPTAPSCTATGTGNNPIASGESFPVKLTVKNANSIKWLCSEFNCTNNSVCNYERDYTVENTLSIDKLDSTGSITTTMAYNNTDSSLKVRRCTFYVSNSATGKTGECKNSVAVKPKESTSSETKCGDANGMEFDSEVGAIENKLGGLSLCKDGVPISSSDNGWSASLNNNYSKQIKWVCGAGLDVYDCIAHVKKAEENETDDNTNNGGSDDTGSGSLPESTDNLCGPVIRGGSFKADNNIMTRTVQPTEVPLIITRENVCSNEGTLVETDVPQMPTQQGSNSDWHCKSKTTSATATCRIHMNSNTESSGNSGTGNTETGNIGTVITTNNPNPGSDVYGKCGNAKGSYSSSTATFRQPFCEIGKVELFDSGKYELGSGQDWNLNGVTSFLKLKTGGIATKMKWTCVGGISTKGLTPDQMSKTCEAFWKTTGKCNPAVNNKTYPSDTERIPAGTTLCEVGNPSPANPVFRQGYEGGWYAEWTCLGEGYNAGDASCSANREVYVDPNGLIGV